MFVHENGIHVREIAVRLREMYLMRVLIEKNIFVLEERRAEVNLRGRVGLKPEKKHILSILFHIQVQICLRLP